MAWERDDTGDRWARARMTGTEIGGVGCYMTPAALALFILAVVVAILAWCD